MNKFPFLLAIVFVTSCAQLPESPVDESQLMSMNCSELSLHEKEVTAIKEQAEQAKKDSWKVVLPFIVAARYAQASAAQTDAEERLSLLNEARIVKKCIV